MTHRYRTGGLSVPAELSGIIVGVLGLDNRPQASPHFRRRGRPQGAVTAHAAAPSGGAAVPLTALQVASFYEFPAGTDGTGQTIAIIELGGGYTAADLTTYFGGLSLAVPSVTAVGVDGGSNSPGQSADGEVELDIEVAGAVAPEGVASRLLRAQHRPGLHRRDLRRDPRHARPRSRSRSAGAARRARGRRSR